jgi:hypothetical protein
VRELFSIVLQSAELLLEDLVRLGQPVHLCSDLILDYPSVALDFVLDHVVLVGFGLDALSIEGLLAFLALVRDVVLPDQYFRLLQQFLGVEEMRADEGGIDVLSIGFALLEGTVEVGIDCFLARLLVDVDAPDRWALGEVGLGVAAPQSIDTKRSLHLTI